jgi:hypothetical protein
VREEVLKRIDEWIERRVAFHDRDIREVAVRYARKIGLPEALFDATHTWLRKLKENNRIAGRHIDEFLTAESVKVPNDGWVNGVEFVKQVRAAIEGRSGDMVFGLRAHSPF